MILEIILFILVIVLGYTTWNTMKKVEAQEDLIQTYEEWVDDFSKAVAESSDKIKQIDHKGTFKSDDEVGYFFNYLKDLQNGLDSFNDVVVKGDNKDGEQTS
tara:strand:+ start:1985 stop:2290 length:306 start_codon:yes stop_codon:yes gene_type:complete